jgi:hypothetical protein
MLLVEREIPRAADVFPLFYDDIRACHVLLSGSDPFADLVISDHHRRLRIEQELREASIRLRRAVVDAAGSMPHVSGVVERKLKQVRGPLLALLTLKGKACEPQLPAVLAAAGEAYGLDVGPLRRIREDARAAHGALVKLLTAAADDVDSMELPARGVGS